MKIPNLSFVLGFRRVSDLLIANEPFTEPELYEPVLEDLRLMAPRLELTGPELRIQCAPNRKPKITAGGYEFVMGTQREQAIWKAELLALAAFGAEYLGKSLAMLKYLPIEEAVDEYLAACGWPNPESVEIDRENRPVINLEQGVGIRHRVQFQGADAKLRLPYLSFLPFPETTTEIMRDMARYLVEERADKLLAQAGEELDPQ